MRAKTVLGDAGVELPHYYGPRFAGERLKQRIASDAYHTHFVGPTSFDRTKPSSWKSDLAADGRMQFEGLYGPEAAGLNTKSSIGGDGHFYTIASGPHRSDVARWQHPKDPKRRGRPEESRTCAWQRRGAHELSTEAWLNPRVGKPCDRSVRAVADPRNGIGFATHGDKVYSTPERSEGFHVNLIEGPGMRRFRAAHPPRPVTAPTHEWLRNQGLRRTERAKKREEVEIVQELDNWAPAVKKDPESESRPPSAKSKGSNAGSRPASGKPGSRPRSGKGKK